MMGHHLMSIRMMATKKRKTTNVGGDVEKLEPCALLVGM